MQTVPLVKDVMTPNVLVSPPDATVMDAARRMRSENRGSIVVIDKTKPIGIVTERDLFKKVVAEGLVPKDVLVKDIMSSPLVFVSPGDSIKSAAKIMVRYASFLARMPWDSFRTLRFRAIQRKVR